MIIEKCPHCETQHVQTEPLHTQVFVPGNPDTNWTVLRCQNNRCRHLVLAITDRHGNVKQLYPSGGFELDSEASISQEIRGDFREAGLCLKAGCYKASMVMSRRALQRCLKEQGCTQHNLIDAIHHAVSSSILRRAFQPLAEEIRQYGNLGAHPDNDQLANANQTSAQQILEFTRLLIHEFYEVPETAGRLRQNRQQP